MKIAKRNRRSLVKEFMIFVKLINFFGAINSSDMFFFWINPSSWNSFLFEFLNKKSREKMTTKIILREPSKLIMFLLTYSKFTRIIDKTGLDSADRTVSKPIRMLDGKISFGNEACSEIPPASTSWEHVPQPDGRTWQPWKF